MKFDVLTLFPEMFDCLKQSIIGRATEKELIDINLVNIRDFSKNKHKKVEDQKGKKNNVKKQTNNTSYEKHSIMDFMEFDDIEDNMIIQKDGKRYLMDFR